METVAPVQEPVVTPVVEPVSPVVPEIKEEPKIEENVITITHKGGKLRCTVLEPQNAIITAIGGGDMRFTTVGIPVPSDKTENRECGWGKVIISPTDKAKTHKFKVKMEILNNEI